MSTKETPDADTTGQFAAPPRAWRDPKTIKLVAGAVLALATLFGGGFVAQSSSPDLDAANIQEQLAAIILSVEFIGARQDKMAREAEQVQRLSGFEAQMEAFRREELRRDERTTWQERSSR